MIPLDLGREMTRCRYKKAGLHPIYTQTISQEGEAGFSGDRMWQGSTVCVIICDLFFALSMGPLEEARKGRPVWGEQSWFPGMYVSLPCNSFFLCLGLFLPLCTPGWQTSEPTGSVTRQWPLNPAWVSALAQFVVGLFTLACGWVQ